MLTLREIKQHIRQPYAWPGGYPLFFWMADGEPLSIAAARERWCDIVSAHTRTPDRQWTVVACEPNYEGGLICSHTGIAIESAYDDNVTWDE